MIEDLIARIRSRAADGRTQTDMASIYLPPRFPPATPAEFQQAEERLGFQLPLFLKVVYLEVGNGGFGPGYGLNGISRGNEDNGQSIIELYESYHVASPDDPSWHWPGGLVPVCDWGCAVFSCVDCHSGAVITFDPAEQGNGESMAACFALSHPSIEDWFKDWVDGVRIWDKLFEHELRPMVNPRTGKSVEYPKRRLRR